MFDEHERGHGFEHGDLDFLPLPGTLAVKQRHGRRVQRGQPGDLVGHDGSDVVGLAGQLLLYRRQAAFGLDRVVVGGPVAVGSAAPVPVAIGVDDLWVDRGDVFIGEAELGDRFGAHRVDEHVGGLNKRAQRPRSGIGLQVQHDAALAAVDVDEHPTHARRGTDRDVTGVIPLWRFDFDHVSAHVGHDLRAVRSHHHCGEVDYPHTGQRSRARPASHEVRLGRWSVARVRSCSGCAGHDRQEPPEKSAAPQCFESHRDVRRRPRPSRLADARRGFRR